MTSLALSALGWLMTLLPDQHPPVLLLGVLMIVGFAMSAVNGMMYKIIPFIIWLHLSARNKVLRDRGERDLQIKVPHMRKIISENAGLWQFRFHLGSLLLLALASIWTSWFYYPAALLFAISQTALLINLSGAARYYNACIAELGRLQLSTSD